MNELFCMKCHTENNADTAIDIVVAHAAPAMPQSSLYINKASRMMLSTAPPASMSMAFMG